MGLVTLPNTLTAGDTARASDVMGNFTTLRDAINGNLNAANLADGAVTAGKLATDAVTTTKVADLAITDAKINDVAASKITGLLGTSALADGSVTTAKLATGAVTATKMGSGAALANIGAGGVTTTYLADGDVTTAKLNDDAVTPAKTSFLDNIASSGKVYFGIVDSSTGTSTLLPTGWSLSQYAAAGFTISHNLGTTDYFVLAMSHEFDSIVHSITKDANQMLMETSKLDLSGDAPGEVHFMVVVY